MSIVDWNESMYLMMCYVWVVNEWMNQLNLFVCLPKISPESYIKLIQTQLIFIMYLVYSKVNTLAFFRLHERKSEAKNHKTLMTFRELKDIFTIPPARNENGLYRENRLCMCACVPVFLRLFIHLFASPFFGMCQYQLRSWRWKTNILYLLHT